MTPGRLIPSSWTAACLAAFPCEETRGRVEPVRELESSFMRSAMVTRRRGRTVPRGPENRLGMSDMAMCLLGKLDKLGDG